MVSTAVLQGQGPLLRAACSMLGIWWAYFHINILFCDSAGDENLVIMADSSSSSSMVALEGLFEDLLKGVKET